jgi:sugar phosphate isomerase/epimerase
MPFKFGVLQNVLGEPLETVFSTAKELGFDGVELDWNAPEEAAEGGVLAPEKRAGIKQAALEAGVEIHAVCAHFLNGGGIASADEATRERGMKALLDGFELAKGVGATALLVPFFGPGESELADAPWTRAGAVRAASAGGRSGQGRRYDRH